DGFGNNELQFYRDGTNNAAMDGSGNLVITVKNESYSGRNYTSAKLDSSGKFEHLYGRFESRMRIPRGQGIWPAFWMLGNDIGSVGWPTSGEIDIMENIGREPNTVHGTIHGPGYSGGEGIGAGYSIGGAFADAFHTFAVEWGPDFIAWFVDGVQYQRRAPADLGGDRWVFNHPFFMIMNVAVGGFWPGDPDGSTVFPQQLVVDYVRVYAWTTGGGGGGGGTSAIIGNGSNRCIDIPSANAVDGARLQLWDCNGTGAQRWTFNADGSITALGKCMDVSGGSTANGAAVQLWTCNGTGAQKFTLSAAGDLVNTQANKCVDVTNAGTANGSKLQLWQCT